MIHDKWMRSWLELRVSLQHHNVVTFAIPISRHLHGRILFVWLDFPALFPESFVPRLCSLQLVLLCRRIDPLRYLPWPFFSWYRHGSSCCFEFTRGVLSSRLSVLTTIWQYLLRWAIMTLKHTIYWRGKAFFTVYCSFSILGTEYGTGRHTQDIIPASNIPIALQASFHAQDQDRSRN